MSAPFMLKAEQYRQAIAHRNTWKRWEAIHKRILSHPDFHFRAPHRILLLRLAELAIVEKSMANKRYWKAVNEF